jgi:hypothetical protein
MMIGASYHKHEEAVWAEVAWSGRENRWEETCDGKDRS